MSFDNNNQEENLTFSAGCFSTNYNNFNSIAIMKQYFMSSECLDIVYKDSQVDFTHKLLGENGTNIICTNVYIELIPFSKNNKNTDKIDCYIIFLDLENNESLIELNKILDYIKTYCDANLKIYVLNFFTNEKNIQSNLTDDNINVYFGKYSLTNYDISTVNLISSDELVKVIDSLTEDTLTDKNLLNNIKKISDGNDDKSKSFCLII